MNIETEEIKEGKLDLMSKILKESLWVRESVYICITRYKILADPEFGLVFFVVVLVK